MIPFEKKTEFRDFTVNKDFGDDEPFFRLITEGGEVQLPKLKFQIGEPLPDKINCRIKGYNGHVPILGHNTARYVSEFYADGFSKGRDFDFKVIALPDNKDGFYRLVDDYGLTYWLRDPKMSLTKGQSVKCKFEVLESNAFRLRRSATDAMLPMITLKDITRIAAVHGVSVPTIEQLLRRIPEMENAFDELNHGRPVWVITALRTIRQVSNALFRSSIDRYPAEAIYDTITGYERVLLYLLQGSNFLRNIKGIERTMLQDEITSQLEQLDIYLRTLDIISHHTQKNFINEILTNLKESGYIFHPTVQFAIMMHIFRCFPELVNSSLGNVFDALMGWDIDIWKSEPFRKAFVDQFEIYISDSREDISRFLQPETAADNEKIEKVLTAIAIQQTLALPTDDIDLHLNISNFYRYLSLLRTSKADTLLQKAYLTLMGVKLPIDYTWSDIKEPTMMMTRAAVDAPPSATIQSTPRYYMTPTLEISAGSEGIVINKYSDEAFNAVPNDLLPWPAPGIKVNVNLKKGLHPSKLRSLDGHAEFWQNVETALFARDDVANQTTVRRKADLDDVVKIIIDKVIPSASDYNRIEAFHCRIVDEHYEEDEGFIKAEDIVSYNLHQVTVGTFRFDDGTPMVFEAEVIAIDENDRYHFSLFNSTHEAVHYLANANDICNCVITKDNGNRYSAISEKGYGLYIEKDPNNLPFHRGNVVMTRITGNENGYVLGVVEDGPIDNYLFSNARALHNMLLAVALPQDDTDGDDPELDDQDSLSREEMLELIELLRCKAIASDANILMAYDYLSVARLLAMAINHDALAANIKAHKELLLICQQYAKNKKIFTDDVQRIQKEAGDNILINRLAQRLLIVGALGKPEENNRLWSLTNTRKNEIEGELARNVLSYNLLYEHDPDDPALNAIRDRIAGKLNVSNEQRNLKYYGSESQFVEFKSSLVYPAQKGKSGISAADPDKQEHEILHIIAGFLNTEGGSLYIGVADDHYERGLDDDLKYYRLDNPDQNKYRRSIRSLDNMSVYLQNLIERSFNLGQIIGEYAKVNIDDESTKGVLVVNIKPCPRIVKLNDEIYVRHSTNTKPLIKREDIEIFTADRNMLYRQLVQEQARETVGNMDTENTSVHVTDNIAEQQRAVAFADKADDNTIATSNARDNVLHDWEERFVQPALYICFINDNEYFITNDEWSINENDSRLVLAVTAEETSGYLLLVYDDESAVKVRIRDLMDRNKNVTAKHFDGKRLVFACPTSDDGALYSLHLNNKSTFYERATPIEQIPMGSMNAVPERIMHAEVADTPLYEYIPGEKLRLFTHIISTGMKRNQIGALAKTDNGVAVSLDDLRDQIARMLK